MRVLNIAIDADGSPSGYISWHNHFNNKSKIRFLKPSQKNEKFGIQRMEMLAIFFAITDNIKAFKKLKRTKQIVIIRSDSLSTIEQLNNKGNIKDKIIQRIYESIKRLLGKISYTIVFDYLRRTKNQAGKLLENIFRKNIKYLTRRDLRNKIGKQLSSYKYKDYNLQYHSTIGYDLKLVMAF